MSDYKHPWLEQNDEPGKTSGVICDKCWQEKSMTGNCWCSDFGDGIYTKESK